VGDAVGYSLGRLDEWAITGSGVDALTLGRTKQRRRSDTTFTLYSRLYNQLGELCKPSQAALERSSQDAYDVIRFTPSKAAAWTADDVASLIDFFTKNSYLFIYFYPR